MKKSSAPSSKNPLLNASGVRQLLDDRIPPDKLSAKETNKDTQMVHRNHGEAHGSRETAGTAASNQKNKNNEHGHMDTLKDTERSENCTNNGEDQLGGSQHFELIERYYQCKRCHIYCVGDNDAISHFQKEKCFSEYTKIPDGMLEEDEIFYLFAGSLPCTMCDYETNDVKSLTVHRQVEHEKPTEVYDPTVKPGRSKARSRTRRNESPRADTISTRTSRRKRERVCYREADSDEDIIFIEQNPLPGRMARPPKKNIKNKSSSARKTPRKNKKQKRKNKNSVAMDTEELDRLKVEAEEVDFGEQERSQKSQAADDAGVQVLVQMMISRNGVPPRIHLNQQETSGISIVSDADVNAHSPPHHNQPHSQQPHSQEGLLPQCAESNVYAGYEIIGNSPHHSSTSLPDISSFYPPSHSILPHVIPPVVAAPNVYAENGTGEEQVLLESSTEALRSSTTQVPSPFPETTRRPQSAVILQENPEKSAVSVAAMEEVQKEEDIEVEDVKPVIDGSGRMKCPHCEKTYVRIRAFNDHLLAKHPVLRRMELCPEMLGIPLGKQVYVCVACSAAFEDELHFQEHAGLHQQNGPKIMTCEHCSEFFLENTAMIKHHKGHGTRISHSGRFRTQLAAFSYSCIPCNTVFKMEEDYLIHLQEHHGHNVVFYRKSCFLGSTEPDLVHFHLQQRRSCTKAFGGAKRDTGIVPASQLKFQPRHLESFIAELEANPEMFTRPGNCDHGGGKREGSRFASCLLEENGEFCLRLVDDEEKQEFHEARTRASEEKSFRNWSKRRFDGLQDFNVINSSDQQRHEEVVTIGTKSRTAKKDKGQRPAPRRSTRSSRQRPTRDIMMETRDPSYSPTRKRRRRTKAAAQVKVEDEAEDPALGDGQNNAKEPKTPQRKAPQKAKRRQPRKTKATKSSSKAKKAEQPAGLPALAPAKTIDKKPSKDTKESQRNLSANDNLQQPADVQAQGQVEQEVYRHPAQMRYSEYRRLQKDQVQRHQPGVGTHNLNTEHRPRPSLGFQSQIGHFENGPPVRQRVEMKRAEEDLPWSDVQGTSRDIVPRGHSPPQRTCRVVAPVQHQPVILPRGNVQGHDEGVPPISELPEEASMANWPLEPTKSEDPEIGNLFNYLYVSENGTDEAFLEQEPSVGESMPLEEDLLRPPEEAVQVSALNEEDIDNLLHPSTPQAGEGRQPHQPEDNAAVLQGVNMLVRNVRPTLPEEDSQMQNHQGGGSTSQLPKTTNSPRRQPAILQRTNRSRRLQPSTSAEDDRKAKKCRMDSDVVHQVLTVQPMPVVQQTPPVQPCVYHRVPVGQTSVVQQVFARQPNALQQVPVPVGARLINGTNDVNSQGVRLISRATITDSPSLFQPFDTTKITRSVQEAFQPNTELRQCSSSDTLSSPGSSTQGLGADDRSLFPQDLLQSPEPTVNPLMFGIDALLNVPQGGAAYNQYLAERGLLPLSDADLLLQGIPGIWTPPQQIQYEVCPDRLHQDNRGVRNRPTVNPTQLPAQQVLQPFAQRMMMAAGAAAQTSRNQRFARGLIQNGIRPETLNPLWLARNGLIPSSNVPFLPAPYVPVPIQPQAGQVFFREPEAHQEMTPSTSRQLPRNTQNGNDSSPSHNSEKSFFRFDAHKIKPPLAKRKLPSASISTDQAVNPSSTNAGQEPSATCGRHPTQHAPRPPTGNDLGKDQEAEDRRDQTTRLPAGGMRSNQRRNTSSRIARQAAKILASLSSGSGSTETPTSRASTSQTTGLHLRAEDPSPNGVPTSVTTGAQLQPGFSIRNEAQLTPRGVSDLQAVQVPVIVHHQSGNQTEPSGDKPPQSSDQEVFFRFVADKVEPPLLNKNASPTPTSAEEAHHDYSDGPLQESSITHLAASAVLQPTKENVLQKDQHVSGYQQKKWRRKSRNSHPRGWKSIGIRGKRTKIEKAASVEIEEQVAQNVKEIYAAYYRRMNAPFRFEGVTVLPTGNLFPSDVWNEELLTPENVSDSGEGTVPVVLPPARQMEPLEPLKELEPSFFQEAAENSLKLPIKSCANCSGCSSGTACHLPLGKDLQVQENLLNQVTELVKINTALLARQVPHLPSPSWGSSPSVYGSPTLMSPTLSLSPQEGGVKVNAAHFPGQVPLLPSSSSRSSLSINGSPTLMSPSSSLSPQEMTAALLACSPSLGLSPRIYVPPTLMSPSSPLSSQEAGLKLNTAMLPDQLSLLSSSSWSWPWISGSSTVSATSSLYPSAGRATPPMLHEMGTKWTPDHLKECSICTRAGPMRAEHMIKIRVDEIEKVLENIVETAKGRWKHIGKWRVDKWRKKLRQKDARICWAHCNPHRIKYRGGELTIGPENVSFSHELLIASIAKDPQQYGNLVRRHMTISRDCPKYFLILSTQRKLMRLNICKAVTCAKGLRTNLDVARHQVHIDYNLSHLCALCGTPFDEPFKVLQHLLEKHHPDVEDVLCELQCPLCPVQKYEVNRFRHHLKKKHADVFNEINPECTTLSFASVEASAAHEAVHGHHKDQYEKGRCCPICGQFDFQKEVPLQGVALKTISHLAVHALQHTVACRHCFLETRNIDFFEHLERDHSFIVGNDNKCSLCGQHVVDYFAHIEDTHMVRNYELPVTEKCVIVEAARPTLESFYGLGAQGQAADRPSSSSSS